MPNQLARIYDLAMSDDAALEQAAAFLVPNPIPRGLLGKAFYKLFTEPHLDADIAKARKDLQLEYLNASKRAAEAAYQDANVSLGFDLNSGVDQGRGVQDKPEGSMSEERLRWFRHKCGPMAAIVNTRRDQASAFASPIGHNRAESDTPGFRIRLNVPDEEATDEDRKNIAMYRQFFEETGFCEPPDGEKPDGWEPGFEPFIKQVVEDRLTLDWVAVQRWKSARDPDKYPIVSFAAVDAAQIKIRKREVVDLAGGRIITKEHDRERQNSRWQIDWVKVDNVSGDVLAEYNANEMFCVRANPRTDETSHGYGYPEAEQAVDVVSGWANGLEFNNLRFTKNSVPRGVFVVFGKLSQQQFKAFQANWISMLRGVDKQWSVPMLQGSAGQGSSVQWVPFDLSPKDMEYSQFMFLAALVLHAIYRIHPEETGFSALSPFRPPLSEASPETNLKYSQDTGLRTMMRWLEGWLNRKILWVLDPSRRYRLEFVGLGDYDRMLDIQQRTASLTAGLSNPLMHWKELDQPIPTELKDHPAWIMPMPFAQGFQLVNAMQQQQQAQEMQEKQMQQAQIQQQLQQRDQNSEPDAEQQEPQSAGVVPQSANKPFAEAGAQKPQTQQF